PTGDHPEREPAMPVRLLCGSLCLVLGWVSLSTAEEKSGSALGELARSVVANSVGVRENDRVQISGTPADIDLLQELAVAVRQRGGHPLITLTSDRLRRRFLSDVPAKFDKQTPRMEAALAEVADVMISMEATDEGALAGLPAERMVAQQNAAEVVNK